MALQIGFANKFYTLWDVTSSIEYGQASHGEVYSYQTVSYNYHQNLSTDLETAQKKAAEKGCTDLEPNHDLFGRNSSWVVRNNKNYCEFNNWTTPYNPEGGCFTQLDAEGVARFRKHYYYDQNIHVINRGIELGVLVRHEDHIMTVEEFENYQAGLAKTARYKKMAEGGETMEIEIEATRNLTPSELGGCLHTEEHGAIYFEQYSRMYYQGFEYGLPVDAKGKAKRIKNKILKLVIEVREINQYGSVGYELFVKSFEIAK